MASANRFNKWSWRVYPLWILLVLAMGAIVFRLGQLQLSDDAHRGRTFLQQQGDARILRNETISASRGEIVDRNGKLLAFSTPVKSIWAQPSLVDYSDNSLAALASALVDGQEASDTELTVTPSACEATQRERYSRPRIFEAFWAGLGVAMKPPKAATA